ncbi:MAG: hypothetical protein AAGC56_00560 [Pseudomonadota bacterium]
MVWLFRFALVTALAMLLYLSVTANTAAADALRPDALDPLSAPLGEAAPLYIAPDKVTHFFAYFTLGVLTPAARIPGLGGFAPALIALSAIGYGLEYAQEFGTARDLNHGDQLANVLGAAVGLLVGVVLNGLLTAIDGLARGAR